MFWLMQIHKFFRRIIFCFLLLFLVFIKFSCHPNFSLFVENIKLGVRHVIYEIRPKLLTSIKIHKKLQLNYIECFFFILVQLSYLTTDQFFTVKSKQVIKIKLQKHWQKQVFVHFYFNASVTVSGKNFCR